MLGSSATEGDALNAKIGGCVQGMRGHILDRTARCAREVEGILCLPAMMGSELGEDCDATDLTFFVLRNEIASVLLVAEEVDDGKMDLRALSIGEPVFHSLVCTSLDVFRYWLAVVEINNFHAIVLRLADFASDLRIRFCRFLGRIYSFFGNAG